MEIPLRIERAWAMPSPATFTIKPIRDLLARYLLNAQVIVDPFAGDSCLATHRNDLNPARANGHSPLHALAYLDGLIRAGIVADAVLLDPPYSPRQISEVYKQIGRQATMADTQNARLYKDSRDRLDALLKPEGIAISCGWNSVGFGKSRGYQQIEILLVCHGGAHNDTIVTVERKSAPIRCPRRPDTRPEEAA